MNTSALKEKEIHDKWKSLYRTAENFKSYGMAYDVIGSYFDKINGPILDAGCGTGEKAIRLVDLGYDVIGVDFAYVALKEGQAI
jgi:SAM-dependent methyltransferase